MVIRPQDAGAGGLALGGEAGVVEDGPGREGEVAGQARGDAAADEGGLDGEGARAAFR